MAGYMRKGNLCLYVMRSIIFEFGVDLFASSRGSIL